MVKEDTSSNVQTLDFKHTNSSTFSGIWQTWRQLGRVPGGQVTVGLGQCRSTIKVAPSPHSLIHSSCLQLLGNKVHLQPQDMSCYTPCQPCQPCGPTPLGSSCNEPCVRQCQDSTVIIEPSPVVVTLPGPILSSFPQNTAVGSSTSAAVGSILSSQGVPISSGGFGLSGLGSGLCGTRCFPC
ncbi:PREDICTED: feather keratin 1-like [Pseudopodoces humilis]|uniref:feather keratin 1-like n=1 Tax=Pseudopodoces humilis TaxID=181119 RepID=UPI0006B78527|nr:PREDICTED: feather keratin 1-like [Pseudopodoces humilis]